TYAPRKKLPLLQAGLLLTFILMNGYLLADVYKKILVPRTLTNFAALERMDLDQKTVLFVNSGDCMDFMREHPRITTELNQVFTSKNTQLKHVLVDNTDAVNLGSYDYIMGCKNRLSDVLKPYAFKKSQSFAGDTFHLFANQMPQTHMSALQHVYSLEAAKNIGAKYEFVTKTLKENFAYTQSDAVHPSSTLQDLFENITPADIRDGAITTTLSTPQTDKRHLYVKGGNEPLYASVTDESLLFTTVNQPGLQAIGTGEQSDPIELPSGKDIAVEYRDPRFDYKNIIPNASFEEGLWQKKVTDCYAYDDKPALDMKLDQEEKVTGRQSLQLKAKQHIACTGPGSIAVRPGEHYLLNFSYQSIGGQYAGYYVSFDNPGKTSSITRIQGEGNDWQTYSKELIVPAGARSMKLMLYAYPHTYGEQTSIVRYDDLSLVNIPPAQNRFYVVGDPAIPIEPPRTIDYAVIDQTKKIIRIRGASAPFFLASSESYNQLWQLELAHPDTKGLLPNSKEAAVVAGKDHSKLNGTMNGWYIDPAKLCGRAPGCFKHPDGTYDFQMTAEFTPQRWFYMGAVVSGLTFIGSTAYFLRGHMRDRREGDGYRWWR
ncbi:MAG: hypothetical protein AAB834_06595, partial [Patescibacteria group bacterium]